ncbi:Uncharacterized protein CK203_100331 [Vitis vinifera]|uniref:RRM domain-containing protein n=1 Tax=Vitis vinifera TaxID=29760 RepID=A0A438D747_VITVI|nr:Uncharacterized protein CK203_100331 [Vitis vinifera]
MSRKREKPYHSRHALSSIAKRRRPSLLELPDSASRDAPATKHSSPGAVLVIGLSPECSVLDLKSRFEIYGCISRIRIDRDGVGYITFRSKDSADAAITASQDPSFGITIDSKRVLFQLPLLPFSIRADLFQVQVLLAKDPNSAVGFGSNKDNGSSSKLLRAEVPLSRHGRSNKLVSSSAKPKTDPIAGLDVAFKGREMVAYDDIL